MSAPRRIAIQRRRARGYRLDLPTVFEIDHPALLALKDARLAQAAGQTPR
jgi:O-methyltransferase involved in polyketide biosynthesis